MKYGLFLYLLLFTAMPAFCQVDTAQQIITGKKNSLAQQQKPYVILISADGFRYDFARKYHAEHLQALADSGVQAPYMIPSYPTLTFPNHYAMVTGLIPSHSGLVGNNFYDAKRNETYISATRAKFIDGTWYNGTPLWLLAGQQDMLSATFYWVGSDAPIHGTFPTYHYNYNDKIDIGSRISTVVNWLKLPTDERPHFITFYLPQVDHEAHRHTPDSPETEQAVRFVDSAVYALTRAVKTTGLDVNFIFVSDHGMIKADKNHPITLASIIDTTKYKFYGDVPIAELYAKKGVDIKADYKKLKKNAAGYDVYLKTNVPRHLRYRAADDRYNRIGDILLVAKAPNVFQFGAYTIHPGQHGYDVAATPEMRATFYAWGPAFKKHTAVKPFNNVSIYNLVARILGLNITEKVDGNFKLADKVLVKK